jgi:hypothetical protein
LALTVDFVLKPLLLPQQLVKELLVKKYYSNNDINHDGHDDDKNDNSPWITDV